MISLRKPTNHKQPWTPADDACILSMAASQPVPAIAKELKRTSAAVEARAATLKVKTFYRYPPGLGRNAGKDKPP
jgi:hypothetical protein